MFFYFMRWSKILSKLETHIIRFKIGYTLHFTRVGMRNSCEKLPPTGYIKQNDPETGE